MAKTAPFDTNSERYEAWFENNPDLYTAELQTLKEIIRGRTNGIDIGMGSGRFAIPLGIRTGIEPSEAMRRIALSKGLHPIDAIAESLPYEDETFAYALMVSVICFVDDPLQALREAYRILRYDGSLIIGIIDKDSARGKTYESDKHESCFYSEAFFYSVDEIVAMAKNAGFEQCIPTRVKATENSFVFIECIKSQKGIML